MLQASVRSTTDATLDAAAGCTSSCDCQREEGECVHFTMLSFYLRHYALGLALIVDDQPPTAGTVCELFTHVPCKASVTKRTVVFGVDVAPRVTSQTEPAIVTVKVGLGKVTMRCSRGHHSSQLHRTETAARGCAHIQLVSQQRRETLTELQRLASEFDGTTTRQKFQQVGGCITMPSFSSRNGGGQPPVYVPHRRPQDVPRDDPYNASWLDMLRGKHDTVCVAARRP